MYAVHALRVVAQAERWLETMSMRIRRTLTVNATESLLARLDRQLAPFKPFVTRHRVAFAALNLGLELLERNPDLLVRFLSQQKGQAS